MVDGAFAKDGQSVRFHPCPALDAADVDEVLATVEAYVQRRLAGSGAGAGDEGDETLDDAPVLAGLATASVQGRAALGPCHARHNGFYLHAGSACPRTSET